MFSEKLANRAEVELDAYKGKKETQPPLRQRIGAYWTWVKRPELDGGDINQPWSAAFISYMVHLAGGGNHFPYSAQHSVYFYRTINDKVIQKASAFWGFEPADLTIGPGDILGMNREDGPVIDYDWASHHADYKSHADIVVGVSGNVIHTIGGNVGNRIGVKTFEWNGNRLKNADAPSQEVFVVIRSFLP